MSALSKKKKMDAVKATLSREREEKEERLKHLKASSGVQHTYVVKKDVKNKVEVKFDNYPHIEKEGIEYSNTEVMLFAPSQENIIDTSTYVVHMAQPYDSTKNFLAMAPAKNCTVKKVNAPGNAGIGEHIVQLSVPEVIAGEPVVWELTWALKNDEYERFMMGAGKWLVTYQY